MDRVDDSKGTASPTPCLNINIALRCDAAWLACDGCTGSAGVPIQADVLSSLYVSLVTRRRASCAGTKLPYRTRRKITCVHQRATERLLAQKHLERFTSSGLHWCIW